MYWRQVVSQSPTTADADQAAIDHYLSVWEPLNQRILTGSSFSGNERNCCFLNTGKADSNGQDQFADISAASSLHHLDDSRSIAVTDWDQDGDLDLWITNRTSPRIRFLRNDTPTKNKSVAFQLEGLPSANCPRDAYGARVEVTFANTSGETTKRSQTLYGGDSFLSQSSKWLNFGMQPDESIQSVSVRWPGSAEPESFSIPSANGRWLLTQSKGVAEELPPRPAQSPLAAKTLAGVPLKATGRLKISWPQSVGELQYRSMTGELVTKNPVSSQPTLYMCWASWCAPCLAELEEISEQDMGNVEIIALNIEEATSGSGPTISQQLNTLKRVGFKGTPGIATIGLLGTLNQKHLDAIYVRSDLPLPVSFLVDQNGMLRVVYKGKLDVEQVAKDLKTLDAKGRNSMALSVPFPGRWSEEYLDGNPIAVARVYVQDGSPEDAVTFLKYYLDVSKPAEDGTSHSKTNPQTNQLRAAASYELAMLAFRSGKPDEGYAHCEASLKLAPKSVPVLLTMISHLASAGEFDKARPYCDTVKQLAGNDPRVSFQLGRVAIGQKDYRAAVVHFEAAFKANPRQLAAGNNLAWILATNSEQQLRDGKRAVEVASRICEATQYKDYRFFSTLAAAYAEDGDFENAIAITKKAIDLAAAKRDEKTVVSMNKRLKLFEAKTPVRD
jgi:tetratricopeptide (TPR) repeat protein